MKKENLYAYFYQNVLKNPKKTALIYGQEEMTFIELALFVKQIEKKLLDKKITSGDFVILSMKNSMEAVAAMLAVHKVGAVILPLDVSLPKSRVEKIYKDCDVSLILCNQGSDLLVSDALVLCIEPFGGNGKGIPVEEIDSQYIANEQAFCIYTSGSNGIPKGVLLSHQGVCNQIQGKTKVLSLTKDSVLCLSLSLGFVASIWEIFSALFLGATLVIYSNEIIKNPYELFKQAEKDHVHVISTLPQMLKSYIVLIENQHKKLEFPDVKYVMLTGEKLHAEIVHSFYQYYQIPIVNAYGQSECSDDTLCYQVPFDFHQDNVPIGKAMIGVKTYLVGEDGIVVTNMNQNETLIGELCIGGKCLSLGYYRDQTLTDEKFVYHKEVEETLFHTGDLVEQSIDGTFTFLGRLDNQVKIRGYRISLEEIESYVLKYPMIEKAAVSAVIDDGTVKEIICFYQCDHEIPYEEISSSLHNVLPSYAIPSRFIKLDQFMYTASGKIDRKRMAKECVIETASTELLHTGDEVEEKIIQIIQEVIPDAGISLDVNTTFHALNMDSLLFLQVAIACEDTFDLMFDENMLLYAMYQNIGDVVAYVRSKIETNEAV